MSISDFKNEIGVSTLNVVEGASGKLFCRVGAERIGVAEGTDLSKPLIVLEMEHEGETWRFICEEKPQKVVATI